MPHYYGYMVDVLDGQVEDLEGDFDHKPAHEEGGRFSYAKWFTKEEERNKSEEYTKKEINAIQQKER